MPNHCPLFHFGWIPRLWLEGLSWPPMLNQSLANLAFFFFVRSFGGEEGFNQGRIGPVVQDGDYAPTWLASEWATTSWEPAHSGN
jgi:hypothetical protein